MAKTKMVRQQPHAAVRQVVKDVLNSRVEHKYYTIVSGSGAVSTTGNMAPLSQHIIQGDGITTRDGETIFIEWLRMIYTANSISSTAAVPTQVRVIIFSDQLNVGSLPGVTELLNTAVFNSQYNPLNIQKNRWKIYYDTVLDVQTASATSSKTFDKTFKINRSCYFSADTDVSAANGKGSLFMLTLASTTGAGVYNETFGMEIKYTDS